MTPRLARREFLALAAGLALAPVACARTPGDETTSPAPSGDTAEAAQERSDTSGRSDATDRRAPSDPTHDRRPGDDADRAEGRDEDRDEDRGRTDDDVDPDDYPASADEWGTDVTGVRRRLDTSDRVVALTFDACGGRGGDGYDEALIDHLLAEEVPATLFLNERWVRAHRDTAAALADEPLFEIANHGTTHRPLSVSGRSAYGIGGTPDAEAVIREVLDNQQTLRRVCGVRARHVRPGTAHADEVAVGIVDDLGLEVVGFDVLGDAGATYSASQVTAALRGARPGSIALLHMNHPGSGTAAGVADAIAALRADGFTFARLGDHRLAA